MQESDAEAAMEPERGNSMKKQVLIALAALANRLDSLGLPKEASSADRLMRKLAGDKVKVRIERFPGGGYKAELLDDDGGETGKEHVWHYDHELPGLASLLGWSGKEEDIEGAQNWLAEEEGFMMEVRDDIMHYFTNP